MENPERLVGKRVRFRPRIGGFLTDDESEAPTYTEAREREITGIVMEYAPEDVGVTYRDPAMYLIYQDDGQTKGYAIEIHGPFTEIGN